MNLEDHELLRIAIGKLIVCANCRFYKAGICTRLKTAFVGSENDDGTFLCCDADGCTFGTIRDEEE